MRPTPSRKIVEDADAGRLREPPASSPNGSSSAFPSAVEWSGWCAIDERERSAGEPAGRPRVKIVRVPELLVAASG